MARRGTVWLGLRPYRDLFAWTFVAFSRCLVWCLASTFSQAYSVVTATLSAMAGIIHASEL